MRLMKVAALAFAILTAIVGRAVAGSTIDPSIPATGSALASAPLRSNFLAAATDINNILAMFGRNNCATITSPSVGQDCLNTGATPATWYKWSGTGWAPIGTIDLASGTFLPSNISVGLSLPAIFSVTGSPVTSIGTLTATLVSQAPGLFFAGPVSGPNATPFFRAIVPSDLPGGFVGFANPSALVGLSAINGSAPTAMRSDAAPALNQGIAPTWTGQHTFSLLPILPNQSANVVYAGPASGSPATPGFRAIVAADLPGAFSGFANPTGSVGLSVVNGSSTNAMRADAAPALSASVQSSLTGANHNVLLGTGAFGFNVAAPSSVAGYAFMSNGSSSDPSFQGYLNPGTGAVTLTIPQKLSQVFSAADFGALCNGSHDDTANIQAAVNTAAAGGLQINGVLLPVGACLTSAAITVPTGVVVFGNSRSNTGIVPTVATQDVFDLTAFNSGVHDINIQFFITPTAGCLINAQGADHWIFNVQLQGGFKSICYSGTTSGGFLRDAEIRTGAPGATGIEVNSTGISVLDINAVNIVGLSSSVSYGIRFINGSASVSNTQILSMGTQVSMEPPNGSANVSTTLSNVWFDNGGVVANNRGLRIRPAAGGSVLRTQLVGFVWCSSQTLGNGCFDIDTSAGGTISSVEIANPMCLLNTGNCIYIGAGATGVKVHGGTISGNTGDGIHVAANATDFSIVGVNIGNYVAGVNGGWGINVVAGTSDQYTIIGNNLNGNTLGSLTDNGTGTHKSVFGNPPVADPFPLLNVNNTWTAPQTLTLSTNGGLGWTCTNSNAGTAAQCSNLFKNGTGTVSVGLAGTGYTGVSLLQNRGFLYADSATAGVVIDAAGASNPAIFATNDTERGRVTPSGGLAWGLTTDTTAGVINVLTGFRINSAATSGNVLRGNGTNFVSAQLACADLSTPCITGNQSITLSGDATGSGTTAITVTNVNLPTGVTVAGTLLHSNIAAPASPASGKVLVWTDSTDLRFHDKNNAGTIGTTVVADTGAANNYISAISPAGVITKSRPACATLSDAGAFCSGTSLTNLTGAGTGVLTALGINIGSAGAVVTFNGALGTPSSATLTNATGLPVAGVTNLSIFGGRLTLASGVPVLNATSCGGSACSAQTTVYYTPFNNNLVTYYDGSNSHTITFSEISVALGSNWAANSNYDFFVGVDSGTTRLCTGPAWTSDTARGTGAGTTQLSTTPGYQTNAVSMTCRYSNSATFTCGVNQCSYVGTMRTGSSTGTTNFVFGSSAAGGGAAIFGLWNNYNRVNFAATVNDSTASWTFSSATAAALDASGTGSGLNNRVTFVMGLAQDAFVCSFTNAIGTAAVAGAAGYVGFALDATNTLDRRLGVYTPVAAANYNYGNVSANYQPQLGLHFVQATQVGDGTNATTSFGNTFAFFDCRDMRM